MTHGTQRAKVTRHERHAEEVVQYFEQMRGEMLMDIRRMRFLVLREVDGLEFNTRPYGANHPDEPTPFAPGSVIEAVRFLPDGEHEDGVEFTIWGRGKMFIFITSQLDDVVFYEVETDVE